MDGGGIDVVDVDILDNEATPSRAGSVALVLSPLPSSPLLSSTDSKIGSNSLMSPARSHERSVCAIPIVLASKRERKGVYHPPCGREKPADMGCTLAPWHFFGGLPLNLGLTYGRLQGHSPNFLDVVRRLFKGMTPKEMPR